MSKFETTMKIGAVVANSILLTVQVLELFTGKKKETQV